MAAYYKSKLDEERCILVGVIPSGGSEWETKDHLFELAQLAYTAGAKPVDQVVQARNRLDPAYFIGRGKARELASALEEKKCQLAIFDDDLSPAQVKNLENLTDVKIIDRSALILDIFALHAKSKEARTQVELAQLNYLLPRLTRQWTHLSRQVGGIGTKGPGETQLETDRRLVRTRIDLLKEELKKIEKQRATQRKMRSSIFKAALVGYTNVGKSTLMKQVTGADVVIENQLFATLDATTRRLNLGPGVEILISDTVGFIRKLPTHLIASFKSTLEEVVNTDLLIHVVDVSSPSFKEHIQTVSSVLKDLKVGDKPQMLVFNKVDLIDNPALLRDLEETYPDSVFISASRAIHIKEFTTQLTKLVENYFVEKTLVIDQKDYDIVNYLHQNGTVLLVHYDQNLVFFKVKMENFKMEKLIRDKRVKIGKMPSKKVNNQ